LALGSFDLIGTMSNFSSGMKGVWMKNRLVEDFSLGMKGAWIGTVD
jgi:hypothetical protein